MLLGGAALTRAYVEQDLAAVYQGTVRYARDAFEGLRLMDAIMGVKRGVPGCRAAAAARPRASPPPPSARDETPARRPARRAPTSPPTTRCPTPPFWGSRVVRGVALADYVSYLDERATFLGQWGLKPGRGEGGASYEELVETEGRPRLRMWLDRVHTDGLLEAAVVYGYFPCYADGDDLVILHHEGDLAGQERARLTFPRQRRDRHLCLSDFFRPKESGETDVIAFHVVTMGNRVAEATGKLFAENAYRDYLELHGLSVQLTEALAEMWHARIRAELGLRRRGRRRHGRPHRQAGLPRLALLLRLPRLPGRRAAGRARRPARARRASASSCPRSSSCTPSSRRRR